MSLVRSVHSSWRVLPNVVCEYDREASKMKQPWPSMGCCAMGEKNPFLV